MYAYYYTMQNLNNSWYLEMTGKEIVFTWRMRMLADIIHIIPNLMCYIYGDFNGCNAIRSVHWHRNDLTFLGNCLGSM